MARYQHALTGRWIARRTTIGCVRLSSAPCFHKRCYSRIADTTQTGSANLLPSKARGPISRPNAIAKTLSALARICTARATWRLEGLCESALTGMFRAGREARLRRQEAFEEIFCLDHCVSVVGERTSEVSPAPRHGEDQSCSLTATIAALKNPRGHPNASAGTNDTSKGSGLK